MIGNITFNQFAKEIMETLPKEGVFLTSKAANKVNTMTIGWGSIGIIWKKPIYTIQVRSSRYTYELIELSRKFTISIPLTVDMKKALSLCGSRSGRDINKFKEFDLTTIPGKAIDCPVIEGCDLYYECKVVYQQVIESSGLMEDFKDKFYPRGDYHTMYFGEIVACYQRV